MRSLPKASASGPHMVQPTWTIERKIDERALPQRKNDHTEGVGPSASVCHIKFTANALPGLPSI
jgi:hypothetical protein